MVPFTHAAFFIAISRQKLHDKKGSRAKKLHDKKSHYVCQGSKQCKNLKKNPEITLYKLLQKYDAITSKSSSGIGQTDITDTGPLT